MAEVMERQEARTRRNAPSAGKYLTFQLSGELYGLEILKVQELIGLMAITKVPQAPAFVRGVINLRGRIIPVVDLRLSFGLQSQEDTDRTCIIVVDVFRSQGRVTMGILVDEVSEVADVTREQIEPPPDFGDSADEAFIEGMAKIGNKVVMLLDADRVIGGAELPALDLLDAAE